MYEGIFYPMPYFKPKECKINDPAVMQIYMNRLENALKVLGIDPESVKGDEKYDDA